MLANEFFLRTDWTDVERLHFQHLALMRPQLATEAQLAHLEGLARNLTSPRLLALMCRTPHWLCHWPLLQNLAQNEATPEALRRDLEMVVSLFAMMRELDVAPAAEKADVADTVKHIYAQLRPDLKPVAKLLAKQLARSLGGSGSTQELPPLPGEDQDWESLLTIPAAPAAAAQPPAPPSLEQQLERALETVQPDELVELMAHGDGGVRAAATQNPLFNEELLCRALHESVHPEFFLEIYHEPRWYFRDAVRETFMEAPACPEDLARKVARSLSLVVWLHGGAKDRGTLRRMASLFTQLEESEYQYVTYWAKRQQPQLLRVVKYFYDRLQRMQSRLSAAVPAQTAPEGRWASLEERVFLASQTTQGDQLSQVLLDPDPQVFRLALENPALTPRILAAVIPSLPKDRAQTLAAHGDWSADPSVREALLHNGQVDEPTALDLLAGLQGMRPLLEVLRNPRIPHLEVKRQAQERLRRLYADLDALQRVHALRSSGGELMRHLPQEVFQDEDTLRLMVSDRQLDPSILLRLARNKLTPRMVLDQIAGHPVLMAHPAIMSELLLNPKTPRESAARVWGLLSESEQQSLLRSPHLPTTLRAMAP
ncbi:MAG TPA: hypothetical protein VJ483_01730 [Holophagaceae bacterium]|nr:hypothetical protein [Holophagaceae bacterium]